MRRETQDQQCKPAGVLAGSPLPLSSRLNSPVLCTCGRLEVTSPPPTRISSDLLVKVQGSGTPGTHTRRGGAYQEVGHMLSAESRLWLFPYHCHSPAPLGLNPQHQCCRPSRKQEVLSQVPLPANTLLSASASSYRLGNIPVFFTVTQQCQGPLPYHLMRGWGLGFFPRGFQDGFNLLANSHSHFGRQVVFPSPINRWKLRLKVTCSGTHSQQDSSLMRGDPLGPPHPENGLKSRSSCCFQASLI